MLCATSSVSSIALAVTSIYLEERLQEVQEATSIFTAAFPSPIFPIASEETSFSMEELRVKAVVGQCLYPVDYQH